MKIAEFFTTTLGNGQVAGLPITMWVTSIVLFILGFYVTSAVVNIQNLPRSLSSFFAGIKSAMLKRSTREESILDAAPFPIWINDGSGTAYSNKCFRETASQNSDCALSNPQSDTHGRLALTIDDQTQWFCTQQVKAGDDTFNFALPVDELVNTEATLKRFMETLSTTFAHLSSGLAIFNADKTLHLFNPALSQLLGLEPTWLAMRPTIPSFLEKLRENRQLPDQKNFLEWRKSLTDLQSGSGAQSYSDQWFLPDGRVLRVSAQPHSRNAIAFVFEDITAQITIERQRRMETALNQAVLDKMSDAVVVLDPSGTISFANTAFDEDFGLDSTGSLMTPCIDTMAKAFPHSRNSDQFWDRLRMYISRTASSDTWIANLTARDGSPRHVDVSATPDGSTLAIFRKEGRIMHTLPRAHELLA